jgi:ketosteroid isomerase-like protein
MAGQNPVRAWGGDMNEDANIQVVRQLYDAFGQGNIDTILQAVTDDVEWHQPGPPDVLPWAGTRHGRAQVAQFFTAVNETLEILQFEPRTFLAHDDTVVVLGYERALAKPTSRSFESEWVMVFTLRASQVVRFRAYHDTAAMVIAFRSLTTYQV